MKLWLLLDLGARGRSLGEQGVEGRAEYLRNRHCDLGVVIAVEREGIVLNSALWQHENC